MISSFGIRRLAALTCAFTAAGGFLYAAGEPPNAAAQTTWDGKSGALRVVYEGAVIFEGRASGEGNAFTDHTDQQGNVVTETITLAGKGLRLDGTVSTPDEAIVLETRGSAQQAFPLVRTTSGGPSNNLRNNAIYDRGRDWLLAAPDGRTRIVPESDTKLRLTSTGDMIVLTFQPRFYQFHKNITYFKPWTYPVRQDSITGWCSWWAYHDNITQADIDQLLAVWKEKRLADYGYRFIQVDHGYETASDTPNDWLTWNQKFPAGMSGYVNAVRAAGFEPGVWTMVAFENEAFVNQHPKWFLRDPLGNAWKGKWVSWCVDPTVPEVEQKQVRPIYRGFHEAGMTYVKIDALRHFLYDGYNSVPAYAAGKGTTSAAIYRTYLQQARDELGPKTFLLSCWGVLPESVGLADGCRLGTDGYNPGTLQQYNSWNGIVWRNDPDHCDVFPQFKPAESGDVTKLSAVSAAPADTIIRPALASIAGAMLMLSDKAEVYRDDANLEGLRRASPVVFSVPGQIDDFDDSRSRNLLTLDRTTLLTGALPTPIDADGTSVTPWWLNGFNRPFEHWNVLHRVNWSSGAANNATVKFADLGLDPARSYLVYEFWSHKFLGEFHDSFDVPSLPPMGIASYSIREQADHPQLVSTNRHLSQGGVDLMDVKWNKVMLTGRSQVVKGDRYELVLYVPPTFHLASAGFAGRKADCVIEKDLARVSFVPAVTGQVDWMITFSKR